MRFRSVLVLIISAVLLSAANVSAQKRVFTTVDPNANAFSDTVDIYDPRTGTITRVGDRLNVGRERPAVFQLASGMVLFAGGLNNRYLNRAEIYNPDDGGITETGEMMSPRSGMAYVLARGDMPLIIGGFNADSRAVRLHVGKIYYGFRNDDNSAATRERHSAWRRNRADHGRI
jgi:hypothetical protein